MPGNHALSDRREDGCTNKNGGTSNEANRHRARTDVRAERLCQLSIRRRAAAVGDGLAVSDDAGVRRRLSQTRNRDRPAWPRKGWAGRRLSWEQRAVIGKDRAGRVVAGSARDAPAGMGTGTAMIEPFQRPAVVGMAEHRAGREKLVQRQGPMKDVAAEQAELPLEIQRGQRLAADHARRKARRVGIDGRDHQVGNFIAAIVPRAAIAQARRDVLAEQAGDMAAGRRQAVVQGRGDQHLDDRLARDALQARVGERAIVSFPNFGHWKTRLALGLGGRMPNTVALPTPWHETQNIHLCTVRDFSELARDLGFKIERAVPITNGAPGAPFANTIWRANWFAEDAVFLLGRK